MSHIRWILIIISLVLGSCQVFKPISTPNPLKTPNTFLGKTDTTGAGSIPWRKFFADQYLTNLIDTALRNNPDLLIATQRIESSRAEFFVRRGALLPSLDAVASAGADRFGNYTMNGVGNFDTNLSPNVGDDRRIPTRPTPDFFLGLRSQWEIDLWGKLRNQRKAAYFRFMATQKGRQLVVTALVAEVARLYYELLDLDNELEVVRKNIGFQQTIVETIEVQKSAGRATELAVQQSAAQLLGTRSLEAKIQQAILRTENQLNFLLGRFPQNVLRGAPIRRQTLPTEVTAGIPSDMLRRRPDIQQAELLLASTNADLSAVRAAFLPALTITPYVGFHSFDASVLLSPASLARGVLGGLTGPVFNRNALRGNYRRSVAENLEAHYTYRRAVLNGYQEVVTQLQGIENLSQVYVLQEQEVRVLLDAVSTANTLYATGYANYLEVITAQRSALEAELQLTSTRKEQFLALIALYRALGGGWE